MLSVQAGQAVPALPAMSAMPSVQSNPAVPDVLTMNGRQQAMHTVLSGVSHVVAASGASRASSARDVWRK